MVTIEPVDTADKAQVRRFVDLPFRIYRDHPQWVPPIRADVYLALNRRKHPYYEHSTADFFLAVRDRRDVGRIAVLENRNYNDYHETDTAQFYFFDCEDDSEAAVALFERAFEWARGRGLAEMVGPKGLSPFDGYGLLQRGFEHRQMMNMMNYNYPYYLDLVEGVGFEKKVDFVSHHISVANFTFPERVHRVAEWIRKRSDLEVVRFRNKGELRRWADRIGRAYNSAFVENWEYVPLTEREIDFVVDNIMLVANPRLIKLIAHQGEVVGFAFVWPDVSAAMQRSKGRLFPFGLLDLLVEMRRTKWLAGNGMGILPEYQGRGGNALLYTEIEKTLQECAVTDCELTQVAESAEQMRKDLETLGGEPYKNHRVYTRAIT
jgi:GNAT superfamily N-acetyltransferase